MRPRAVHTRAASAVVLSLVVLVGCSRPTTSESPAVPSATTTASLASSPEPTPSGPIPIITPSTSADPSSVLLTCGGDERFLAAAIAGVGLAEFENDAAAAVLKSIIAEAAEPDLFPDHGWHRVAAGPNGVVFVAQGPGDPAWVMVDAGPGPDGWTVDAYGACDLQPALPRGIWPADFWLDPAAPPPGPDDTTLHGLILERACANGKPPVGRVRPPVVVFDERTVVVTVTVKEVPGGADCPGNPAMPITIELGQPLGDRRILDGSVFPPRDASVPPR